MPKQIGKNISVESMVTSREKEPAVMLRLGEEFVTMPTGQARAVAFHLVEAAEAAEQDAFFYKFLMGKLDFTEQQAVLLIREMRENRGVNENGK